MYLIKFIRTNENQLILHSKGTFSYTFIETSLTTGNPEVVYQQIQTGPLDVYSMQSSPSLEGLSQVVSLILYKKKETTKLTRVVELDADDRSEDMSANSIWVYYGRSPCCTECHSYCSSIGRGGNVFEILSIIFGLALVLFVLLWIVLGFMILCRRPKKSAPGLQTQQTGLAQNDPQFMGNPQREYKFNENQVNVANNLAESNDFQTNQEETFGTG